MIDTNLFSSSAAFFAENLSEDSVQGFLRLARGERPVDGLVRRLDASDADSWLRRQFDSAYDEGPDLADRLVSGKLDLEALQRLKNVSKRTRRDATDNDARLVAIAGFVLSVASGLAHHGEYLSTQARSDVDSVFRDLLRVMEEPWKPLLRSALDCRQAFPSTDISHVPELLDRGSNAEPQLLRYTMELYRWPLRVYFLGSTFRDQGDPDAVVAEFFAEKLSEIHRKWLTHREAVDPTMRLGVWIRNAFRYFLLERRTGIASEAGNRVKERGARIETGDTAASPESDPTTAFDQALALETVRHAIEATSEYASTHGGEKEWRACLAFHYHGHSSAEVAATFGVSENNVRRLYKRGRDRFRQIFRRFLLGDGVPPDQAGEAIDDFMRLFDPD